MRSAVDVDYNWVFLRRVEVGRFHHTPIEVGDAIVGFHATHFEGGLSISRPWIVAAKQFGGLAGEGVGYGSHARHIGFAPGVDHPFAVG